MEVDRRVKTSQLTFGDVVVEKKTNRRFLILKNRGCIALAIGLDDKTFTSRFDLEDVGEEGVDYELREATFEELRWTVKPMIDDFYAQY